MLLLARYEFSRSQYIGFKVVVLLCSFLGGQFINKCYTSQKLCYIIANNYELQSLGEFPSEQ